MVWKGIKVIPIGLLAIVLFAMSILGCGGSVWGESYAHDQGAFITDRVVEVRIVMKEEDWTACQVNALAEQYVQADFWFDGELVPDVAVRPKGNSSLNQAFRSGSSRLSLKVDFNFFNSARTFRGLKKLNFNNGFNDPTLIRERLGYEIFAEMGVPTPRTSHVDLWVNDTHLGVYTQVEQIDKTFLSRYFSKDNGNLYKPEMPAAYLNWTESDLEKQRAKPGYARKDYSSNSQQINIGGSKWDELLEALQEEYPANTEYVTPILPNAPPSEPPLPGAPPVAPRRQPTDYIEQMSLKTNENSPNHEALFHFLDILNNEPDETFPDEIEKVLDVDGALRFLAVSTIQVYLDSYLGMGHNYYLYEVDGKFTIIPWDLNGTFGVCNWGINRTGIINFYIDEPTCGPMTDRPLIDRLLSHQPYLDAYHGYLEELLDGPFSVDVMESRINEIADLIRPYVQADELKFSSTADFEHNLTKDIKRAGGGGPTVVAPPPIPQLSPKSLSCIKKQFDRSAFEELLTRKPSAAELEKLRSCLSPEELKNLLQDRPGQAAPSPPQLLKEPERTFIGLKAFVVERGESVRQQLEGKRPSAGDGSGNGGKFGQKDRKP